MLLSMGGALRLPRPAFFGQIEWVMARQRPAAKAMVVTTLVAAVAADVHIWSAPRSATRRGTGAAWG